MIIFLIKISSTVNINKYNHSFPLNCYAKRFPLICSCLKWPLLHSSNFIKYKTITSDSLRRLLILSVKFVWYSIMFSSTYDYFEWWWQQYAQAVPTSTVVPDQKRYIQWNWAKWFYSMGKYDYSVTFKNI